MAAGSAPGGLFQGARFWLSHEIPQRSRFKDLIVQHGGVVVWMEKDANVKLVDHTKKNLPADCYSYQYVEKSIRHGRLENLEEHRAGPSNPRPMGASNIPRKNTRTSWTLEQDQLLYDFLQPFEQQENGRVQGNKIYQLFETRFPRLGHTWQSTRARYLKRLRGNPRPGGGVPRPDVLQPQPQEKPQDRPNNRPQERSQKKLRNDSQDRPQDSLPSKPQSKTPAKPQLQPPKELHTPPTPQVAVIKASPERAPLLEYRWMSKRKRDSPPRSSPEPQASRSKRRAVQVSPTPAPHDVPEQPLRPIPPPLKTATPTQVSRHVEESPVPQRSDPHARVTSESPFPPSPAHSPTEDDKLRQELLQDLPFLLSSPASDSGSLEDDNYDENSQSESEEEEMMEWIETQVSRGMDDALIDDALCCTSLNCKLAEKVLNLLASGHGIPDNIRGVWTAEDDKNLEGANEREIKQVYEKHGDAKCQQRWKYLSMARERGMV
ncbi:hypothetical protein N7532_008698 [Penicillium argentinense]|uniref:DNA-binding protein RAP1 n=1 Tax=Penicillium argentinense TaxID=1131581 RepID=A0A9W9K1U7_9EURO|nr:uncharacterized protein N7532_008698 [Penicillium argentinense]KAJ5090014.1 hypothetical protein N7532_008698 [Penicillium argentinense]